MTAQEVTVRVEADIAGRTTNSHGWDFRPQLLTVPVVTVYADHNGQPVSLWTVLIEGENQSGYHVVFDPQSSEFGLATSGVWIGRYGSFLDTLDAM